MRLSSSLRIIALCLLLIATTGLVQAYETPDSIVAAGKVYVSDVVLYPGSFFSGDTGTATFYVTNGNSNQSIVVNHVTFGDQTIRLTSRPYDSSANIGPLQTQMFVFSVVTTALEGTYYPTFSLSFRDADSLYYRAVVKVDNKPLELTILDKPDIYAEGKKKTISVQVANPRDDDVDNVILDIKGDGAIIIPSRIFIGTIASGEKVPVNFSVTPENDSPLNLELSYDNGDNPHTVTLDIPLNFGTDKKQADPVVSNIQVTNSGGIYHITGDVNNAGLETANTVMVSTLSPAVPQDPYKTYVVGALKPDDFGSFEVTFSANATTIPLQLIYKDADGNLYTRDQDVKISSLPSSSTASKVSPGLLPIAAAVIIVVVFVGGWILHLRRNKK
jgi:hypothetical protein